MNGDLCSYCISSRGHCGRSGNFLWVKLLHFLMLDGTGFKAKSEDIGFFGVALLEDAIVLR
jgi:hypothetical protein